jgi:hypothetical protein
MFTSADKGAPELASYFGQGLKRAAAALDVGFRTDLPMTPPDEVSFPWLRLIGVLETAQPGSPAPVGPDLMHEVEALQIHEQSLDLQRLTGGADYRKDSLDRFTQRSLIAGLAASPYDSQALREYPRQIQRQS